MKIIIFLLFSLFTSTIFAFSNNPFINGCSAPDNLASYDKFIGNYTLNGGSDFASPGLYVEGDVSISGNATFTGNIYATGNVTVSYFSTVNGSVYAEGSSSISWTSRVTGENCRGTLPPLNYCENPPDISAYTYHQGNLVVPSGTTLSGNYHVAGDLILQGTSGTEITQLYGNVYVEGDIYLNKKSNITGDAYVVGTINSSDRGNTTVAGAICEGGSYLIDLPVDELAAQCSAIFKDAAQSHSGGRLTMSPNATIVDDTSKFDFASDQSWNYASGCGDGIPCTITGKRSTKLSDFNVPTITGENIFIENKYMTLGDTGTVFGRIEVKNGTLTLAKQSAQIYQIDRLNLYNGGKIKLYAGVYALRGLQIANPDSQIEVVGEGTVYLFVNKIDSIQGNIIKQSASARVVIVTKEALDINNNAQIYADIYSKNNVVLNTSADVYGRVAAANLTMNSTVPTIRNNVQCDAPPINDYIFNITTGSDALTCEPHSISIQVLLDGNPVTDYVGTINLATSTNKGVWSKLNADGTLTDLGSADNGQASYQFVASDQGVIELGLFNNSASELTVAVSSGAVSNVSGLISFRPYQLKAELSCINQLDSACINIANRPFDLKLTAVGKDPSTDACQVIEEYTGDKQLKFWSSYLLPEVPVGLNVEVNQTAIEKSATNATAQSVTFLNGVATVAVNYPDAGKIQIQARDDQGIGAPPGVIGDELQGGVTPIVNPYKLVINNVTKDQRNLSSDRVISAAGFIRASVPDYADLQVDTFDLQVKAIIDCSSTGVASHCGNSLGDTVYVLAPSFAHNINLEKSLIAPASGLLGYISYDNQTPVDSPEADKPLAVKMTAGQFTYTDLAYDEVGSLGLQANSENYIVTGNNISASARENIGRFYPDYLAYGSYSVTPACNGDFTYLSQQASRLNYTLQAYAQSATAKVTTNYDDTLGYPVASSADFFDYAYATATELTPRLLANDYYLPSGWVRGVYTVSELLGIDKATSADGPYFSADNAANYFIELSGYDGEKVQTDSGNLCPDNRCLIGSLGDLVDGRLQAGNGHGSEYQPLRTTVRATYYDGDNFVPFVRDICTTVALSQVQKETIAGSVNDITAKTVITISNTPLINGESYFDFSAPQERGKLNYFIDLHTVSPWQLDSGNGVGCAGASAGVKECIKGFVEFGLFRGNDRIIYRLQTFNE